jgi:ferric-dicitrate binding protein FerR (iron transport regulator)
MILSISEKIIIKSIRKTACPDELEVLNQWLKKDKKNAGLYFQLEEIWNFRKDLSEDMILNNWEKLSAEIANRPHRKMCVPVPSKNRSFIWLRYVAAIFAGMLIASTIRKNLPPEETVNEQNMQVRNVVFNHTGIQRILLPDYSEVWISEKTQITYSEKFTEGKRAVALEGKAYFDIRKDPGKPFIVQIENMEIEVTGTEFFVESVLEGESFVTLITGSVNLNYNNASIALIPGQQANINPLNGDIKVSDIDTYYYVAWKDGTYRFTDEPLGKIAKLLAKRFDLDIQVVKSLEGKRFTGRVTPEESIEDVLNTISMSYPVKYKKTGKIIQISEP